MSKNLVPLGNIYLNRGFSFYSHAEFVARIIIIMLSVRRVYDRSRANIKIFLFFRNTLESHQNENKNAKPLIPHSTNKRLYGFYGVQNLVKFHEFGGSFSQFRGFYSRIRDEIEEVENQEKSDEEMEEEEEEEDDCEGEEAGHGKTKYVSSNVPPMWDVVLECESGDLVVPALERWLERGNVLTTREAIITMRILGRVKLWKRACDVSSWLWRKNAIDFDEGYFATHLDCLFKTNGMFRAQEYLREIPHSVKGIKVYRSLLKIYVNIRSIAKSEILFMQMERKGFDLDVGDYNTMLRLYLRTTKWKIPNLLKVMEEANIKPDIGTYKVLISYKSTVKEIGGMLRLVERMKAEGITPDIDVLEILVKRFIESGMVGRAEIILSELEKLCNQEGFSKKHFLVRRLLLHYAHLKREKDVERHWKKIVSDDEIALKDYIRGISAWGKLGKVNKAERIFECLLDSRYNVMAYHYNALLEVYVYNNLQSKAEELIEQMSKKGIKFVRLIRSTLVTLYVNLGDLPKAESLLADENGHIILKPTYDSMLLILQKYAERGDTTNAERIFDTMESVGYNGRFKMFEALVQTYIKANICPQGMKERMQAANFIPNRELMILVKKLDTLPKNPL